MAANDRQIPMIPGVVPGVVPDMTEASQQHALRVAHDELPYIPGTQVCLAFFTIEEGLDQASKLYTADKVDLLRQHVAAVGGSDPAIVFAYRKPHGATL